MYTSVRPSVGSVTFTSETLVRPSVCRTSSYRHAVHHRWSQGLRSFQLSRLKGQFLFFEGMRTVCGVTRDLNLFSVKVKHNVFSLYFQWNGKKMEGHRPTLELCLEISFHQIHFLWCIGFVAGTLKLVTHFTRIISLATWLSLCTQYILFIIIIMWGNYYHVLLITSIDCYYRKVGMGFPIQWHPNFIRSPFVVENKKAKIGFLTVKWWKSTVKFIRSTTSNSTVFRSRSLEDVYVEKFPSHFTMLSFLICVSGKWSAIVQGKRRCNSFAVFWRCVNSRYCYYVIIINPPHYNRKKTLISLVG